AGRGDFEEIKINIVQTGIGPLDPVVGPHAEGQKFVRAFQRLVHARLHALGALQPGPFDEGAGPHVVAAARTGGKDENSHAKNGTKVDFLPVEPSVIWAAST